MRKFVTMALLLCLLLSFTIQVHATENETGSIEIQVKYGTTPVNGGDLIAVRVGYVDADALIFRNMITDEAIRNLGTVDTVTQLQNFYTSNIASFADLYETEVKGGIGKFTDLPQGLYLIYQETAAEGYNKLPAFLVTVPYEGNMNVSIASKPELNRNPEPVTEPPSEPTTEPSTEPSTEPTTEPPTETPTEIPTEPPKDPDNLTQSGQLVWPIPLMGMIGTVLFVIGWWLIFGRKDEKKLGALLVVLGIILVLGAFLLLQNNRQEDQQAQEYSQEVIETLREEVQQVQEIAATEGFLDVTEYVPIEYLEPKDLLMTEKIINGYAYIGYLTIPDLKLDLPVMSSWDYTRLEKAPCRYYGSVRGEDLVIVAHNYRSHFGYISKLSLGAAVNFTDMEGNLWKYQVVATDVLPANAVEEMTSGECDLTLYTCATNRTHRITIRCDLIEE